MRGLYDSAIEKFQDELQYIIVRIYLSKVKRLKSCKIGYAI